MLSRLTPKRRQADPVEPPAAPAPTPLDVTLAYHAVTKHAPYRYARSLGYMDWDTQPDPFRRYHGAPLLALDQVPPTPEPAYDALFRPGAMPPRPLDRRFVSQLFYDSLALSAWKQYGDSRWALRVNPSSGNLHPTEGYLLAGPIPGLLERPALCHYAPAEHGLEVRAELPDPLWHEVAGQLPSGALLLGLTSIHWREAWKYGERAFRYCMHDVGHAVAAVTLAAAALGWRAQLLESLDDRELAVLLGVHGQDGNEAEHPDCLLALYPPVGSSGFSRSETAEAVTTSLRLRPALMEAWASLPLAGQPNTLSAEHHDWPIIDDVAQATERRQAPADAYFQPAPDALRSPLPAPRSASARQIIRQRRSAVDMDGLTSISRATFYAMLQRLLPGQPPYTALPWRPAIHLALFVHRVADLASGLYLLVRDPAQREPLRTALNPDFVWQRPPDCPEGLDLSLLAAGDMRAAAQGVSCGQEIAANGAFAVGMLAEFSERLTQHGSWFYRRLHWEAGAIGQVLYLETEAAGLRGTGIGCFFDDSMHTLLGLAGYRTRGQPDTRYQTLYHFTVGGPVDDPRLRTLAPY
ncbi:MAG TPA: SagB/ThcOx family dehydrogenase [Anaerolineae bacterium]|nr:SagB/ThcOx family dehydrogenase [Anaerolineae bacterium]